MNKPIIEVKNIWKKYTYGQLLPYLTLRDSIGNIFRQPLNLLKQNQESSKNSLNKNEFWVLQDISFHINKGEIVGIIGRNGAGKSTLLKILSRITPPDRGEIILRGRVNSLLEVGTGFQGELTGRENIYLNGAILGMLQSEIREKFDEIVAFSEIGKFLDTPVKHYSSGMYVRLAFSVAAHLQPEILIIDEVLAVGDIAFQKKCLGKIENVANMGRTVLFVSHNIGAIRNLCSRTILIDAGKVVMVGPTEQTLYAYNKLMRNIKIDDKTLIHNQAVRRGSGAIRFTSVLLLDMDGKKRYDYILGETVKFKLSYKIFKEVKGLVVSVSLRSGNTREFVTSIQHSISEGVQNVGTVGLAIIELPLTNIRPGEYPLYFHISEKYGQKTNIDVIDDLTAPLVILNKNDAGDPDINQNQFIGYFSMQSNLVLNEINKK